jgi:putative lipoprotein
MRSLHGEAILPESAPARPAARMLVEVHDVSPAEPVLVTQAVLADVPLAPHRIIEFDVDDIPVATDGQLLALRVHVDLEGTGTVTPGDLITTEQVPVPAEGELAGLVAPLTLV